MSDGAGAVPHQGGRPFASPFGPRSGPGEEWTLSTADRQQPAGRVLALVLEGYLGTFRSKEAGVRADRDTEELHDYRVALRRSRSLLASGRRVFPAGELELLRASASWFASVTSPVRDLDVMGQDLPLLAARLSPPLTEGIESLADDLANQRARAFGELRGALDGDRYRDLLRRWQTMAAVHRLGGSDPGPDAGRPAGSVVDDLILRAHRRVRRRAKVAMSSDDLHAWHDLRKALKRFRYLIASFSPLYADGSFKDVQKRLSELQDTLGRLQDHHVQAELISETGIAIGGRAGLTAGALADVLHRDAESAHRSCRHAWTEFDRERFELEPFERGT